MSLLLLFIDGVGIAPPGDANPLSAARSMLAVTDADRAGRRLSGLPNGWDGHVLDATLGVDGLPQSATGQTTLFTGVNAARRLGHHQSALPGSTLRRVLREKSIFRRLARDGYRVTFANAFRPESSARLDGPLPRRVSASTVAFWTAGVRFRDSHDLRRGRAVFHDVTGAALRDRGIDVPDGSPELAARSLASLAEDYDLVFFEHFETDLIGHRRIERDAADHVATLERLVGSLTDRLDPNRDGVLIVSDHGNLEDGTTRTHTRNPVPFLTWGRARAMGERSPRSLTDVAPAVRSWMHERWGSA